MTENNIDIVIPWVDSSDSIWQKSYEKFAKERNIRLNGNERFRDYGTLKYVFRSIEKYSPWIHSIFLITNGQKPSWLNLKSEKIKLIKHEEYICENYLPTFNSNVIEGNIPNIKDLSDNFILFNDDTIINGNVKPTDFFKNGIPLESAVLNPIFPTKNGIDNIVVNDLAIINNNFKKKNVIRKNFLKFYNIKYGISILKTLFLFPHNSFCGFVDGHLPVSYDKKIFKMVVDDNKSTFIKTFHNRFRSNDDINHWLIRYWQICLGHFVPRNVNFGRYYSIDELEGIRLTLTDEKVKLLCLNDKSIGNSYEKVSKELNILLEEKFPQKSSFEI